MAELTCPGCLERDRRIAALERRVAELEALVRDLLARLGTNASNSSTPPTRRRLPSPSPRHRPARSPEPSPVTPPISNADCRRNASRKPSPSSRPTASAATNPYPRTRSERPRADLASGRRRCWLWLAATHTVAVFLIHLGRRFQALKALLGHDVRGIVCSDRWSVYDQWPLERRQICWAHRKRDFQKLVDRGGPSAPVGQALLNIKKRVFREWHLFRGGGFNRTVLHERLDQDAEPFERLLQRGCRCADTKTAAFGGNVLALLPAVWQFVVTAGVEPTNNHAERLLRRGELWRKNAFGCHSTRGCRFVERILTAVQTLRLQERPVLGYLSEALVAHRNGLQAPSLLIFS